MRDDLYTKTIMTLIAVALSVIAWKLPSVNTAAAQFGSSGCGTAGSPCYVTNSGGIPLNVRVDR
jgi:hypothetical protein